MWLGLYLIGLGMALIGIIKGLWETRYIRKNSIIYPANHCPKDSSVILYIAGTLLCALIAIAF